MGFGLIGDYYTPISFLFWEFDLQTLSLDQDRDLIIGRLLSSGGWDGIQWLCSEFSEGELRNWILRAKGRDISPPRLRFWELLLDLPHTQVNHWLSEKSRRIWDERTAS